MVMARLLPLLLQMLLKVAMISSVLAKILYVFVSIRYIRVFAEVPRLCSQGHAPDEATPTASNDRPAGSKVGQRVAPRAFEVEVVELQGLLGALRVPESCKGFGGWRSTRESRKRLSFLQVLRCASRAQQVGVWNSR